MELTIKFETKMKPKVPAKKFKSRSKVSLPVYKTARRRRRKIQQRIKIKQYVCFPINANAVDFPVVWREIRENMIFCDGTVQCIDKKFSVHRAILSAVSPFFRAVFLNTINGGYPEVKHAHIKIPGNMFKLILDFAYTGKCYVSYENVQRLLICADQLEVLGVVKLCSQFIMANLDFYNCLEAFLFAEDFFCQDLSQNCYGYIMRHFVQVLNSSSTFCALSLDTLCKILSDDHLNVKTETLVFDAVRVWVTYNQDFRQQFLPKLLNCIRIGLISPFYYLQVMLKWDLIEKNEECLDTLYETKFRLISLPMDPPYYLCGEIACRPRIPYEIIFVIGGWSAGSPTSLIETYDCRADRWLLCVHNGSLPRAYHGLAFLNGIIYMIGGFDGTDHFSTVRSFNPVTLEWKDLCCMHYSRCYISVVQLDGKIYAIGGFNGRIRLNTAERYDPESNKWELIAPMLRSRSDASACALKQKIIVAGGFNGTEILRSAEMYDPEHNQWTFIASLNEPRSGVSLVACDEIVYAFGGFNGYMRLRSMERYFSNQNEWIRGPHMIHPRSNFAAVVLDDNIFIIGGFNGTTTISNVERYDVVRQSWFHVTSMSFNRSALSACVAKDLPNAIQYSFVYNKNKNSNTLEET